MRFGRNETLFNTADRHGVLDRLTGVRSESQRRFGRAALDLPGTDQQPENWNPSLNGGTSDLGIVENNAFDRDAGRLLHTSALGAIESYREKTEQNPALSSRLALSFLLSQGTKNHVATFLLYRFDVLRAASRSSNNAGARIAIRRSRRPASERTHGSFRPSWLRGSRSKNHGGAHEAVR